MRFQLVDKIVSIERGKSPTPRSLGEGARIVTVKAVSLAEEYLADHFPAFPVLPGVLMIEAMVQSAAWLVRVEQDFSKSIIELSAARNVRPSSFVKPGDVLRCNLEAQEITDASAKFKGTGFVGDEAVLSGRLELKCFNLAEIDPRLAKADAAILAQLREQFKLVGGPALLGWKES